MMRFYMRFVSADETGYYVTQWSKASPIEVVADTQAEALRKVHAVLGAPARGQKWYIKTDRIVEEVLTTQELADLTDAAVRGLRLHVPHLEPTAESGKGGGVPARPFLNRDGKE